MTVAMAPHDLARAVAAHGLPGAALSWPDAPLPDAEWTAFMRLVDHQRLSGLVVKAAGDGQLPVTDDQAAWVSEAHWTSVCGTLFLESTLLRVLDLLGAASVPVRVLKGSAVAHLDYAEPETRLFGDNDLLVPGERFDDAVAALVADGSTRRFPEPRPGFDRRFSKGTSFTTPEQNDIDLHRTFVMGPYGLRLDTRDLWQDGRTFALAGREVEALADVPRFLHACFHAALGNIEPRLVPQRDVAQMALRPDFPTQQVLALARRWQAEPVVARAVRVTWQTFGLADITALSAWAHRYQPSPAAARDLAVYSDPAGSYAAKSLRAVRAVPGLRGKVAFASALAFPTGAYVAPRHSGPLGRWRRGFAVLRHRSGR